MKVDMNMTLAQFAEELKHEYQMNNWALQDAQCNLEGLIEDGEVIGHETIVAARQSVIRHAIATTNNKTMIRLMKQMGVQF